MAKKKKNRNYVTEKTVQAKTQREQARQAEKRKKTVKQTVCITLITVLIAGVILGGGALLGMFDYYPTATQHAVIEIEGYDTALHVELYGNDAPKTVENFVKLVEEGHFDGMSLLSFVDGCLYAGGENADGGDKGIQGEFSDNGVKNRIPHKRGTLSMARGEDKDSAYDQFFIVTKKASRLNGSYAAFGAIDKDGMKIIDDILSKLQLDANGKINAASAPKIKSISLHDSHGH